MHLLLNQEKKKKQKKVSTKRPTEGGKWVTLEKGGDYHCRVEWGQLSGKPRRGGRQSSTGTWGRGPDEKKIRRKQESAAKPEFRSILCFSNRANKYSKGLSAKTCFNAGGRGIFAKEIGE